VKNAEEKQFAVQSGARERLNGWLFYGINDTGIAIKAGDFTYR
jgi:hypothetical protein